MHSLSREVTCTKWLWAPGHIPMLLRDSRSVMDRHAIAYRQASGNRRA